MFSVAIEMFKRLNPRLVRTVAGVMVGLLVVFFVYRAFAAYGDGRFQEGARAERQVWEAADRKLQEEMVKAGVKANKAAEIRHIAHTKAVAQEREKINEAISEGRSPLDSMFGG